MIMSIDRYKYCWGYLTKLTIPCDIYDLYCWYNDITELSIPDNLRELRCQGNNIRELRLNKLNKLECDMFVEIKDINNKELKISFEND